MDTDNKLQVAVDISFMIDSKISLLRNQLQELIGDLQREHRPHEAGILIGVSASLKDSFYRKLGGQLQDMQE